MNYSPSQKRFCSAPLHPRAANTPSDSSMEIWIYITEHRLFLGAAFCCFTGITYALLLLMFLLTPLLMLFHSLCSYLFDCLCSYLRSGLFVCLSGCLYICLCGCLWGYLCCCFCGYLCKWLFMWLLFAHSVAYIGSFLSIERVW